MHPFTDAHLDIAWSSIKNGRDFVSGHPDSALGLPDLLAGGVTLAGATVFTADFDPEEETAKGLAEVQLAYYDALPGRSGKKVVWPADAMDVGMARPGETVCLIGLMEGCEPVEGVEDMAGYYQRGIRVVGLTWNRRNRWAAGCDDAGGVSDEGRELLREIDRLGMIHDVSHLSRRSLDQILEDTRGPILASHVGADAVFEHVRNLTDEHLKAVANRGGVVGQVFYSKFLAEGRATMDDLMRHLMHLLEVCGPDAVGLGTDLDGGFGRDQLPTGIHSAADLPKVAQELASRGVPEADVAKVCGGNFRRLLTAVM